MGACIVHLLMRFFWSSLWSGELQIKASVISHKMANWISWLLKHPVVSFLLLVCKLSFMFSGGRLMYFGLIWHILIYHCSLECHCEILTYCQISFHLQLLSSVSVCPFFLCTLSLCPDINFCCYIRRSFTKYIQNTCSANYKDSYCIFFVVLILFTKDSTRGLW